MKKSGKIGKIIATVPYCLVCLYFCMFTLFNSVDRIYSLLLHTTLGHDFLDITEYMIFPFFIISIIGFMSCVYLLVLYRNFKQTFPLLVMPILNIILFFTFDFIVYGGIAKYTYWIFSILFVADAVFSVYLLVKEKNT